MEVAKKEFIKSLTLRPRSRIILSKREPAVIYREKFNIDGTDFVYIEPILFLYRSNAGHIICSEKELGDTVEAYLKVVREGLAGCGVDERNFDYVASKLGIKLSEEQKYQLREDPIDVIANLDVTVLKVVEYDTDLGRKALGNWPTFLDEVFHGYDPFLVNFYRGLVPPWPHVRHAPHAFLGTNSGVGKSTIASKIGEVTGDITVASLIGGKFDGGVQKGLLDGKDYLVQIERLESTHDKDAIGKFENLLANGWAERWVAGKRVVTKFSGCIVFTFNTIEGSKEDFGNMIAAFSTNPYALGTRFILVAAKDLMHPRGEEVDPRVVREAVMAVRYLVRKKVAEAYTKEVREWFDSYLEEWEEIEELVESENWELDRVKGYMLSYAREGYRKLKALAFSRAVSEYLDKIYRGEVEPRKLLEVASEYLPIYLKMLKDSVAVFAQLHEISLDRIITDLTANDRRKFDRAVLESLYNLARRKYSLEAYSNLEAEFSLSELADWVRTVGQYTKKISQNKIEQKLMKLNDRDIFKIMNFRYDPVRKAVTVHLGTLFEIYRKYAQEAEVK